MADILQGTSSHATYAPLSHGQTVSICKHLQDQINHLMERCGSIDQDFSDHADAIRSIREHLSNKDLNDQASKEERAQISATLDQTRKDLGRNIAAANKLQQGLEQSNENIASLRERQKVMNVGMDKLSQDLQQTTNLAQGVRDVMENRVFVDIEKLRQGLTQHGVDITRLNQESELHKATLQKQKDELRAARNATQGVADDLSKTNAHTALLEQRLKELGKVLRDTRQGLSETNSATVRLQEDSDHSRQLINELQKGLNAVTHHCKEVHGGLDRTNTDLESTKALLNSVHSTAEACRQGLEAAKAHIRSLTEGQDRSNNNQHQMAGQLKQAQMVLGEIKRTLNHTNSLVLPNLQMDPTTGRGPLGDTASMSGGAPMSARGNSASKKKSGEKQSALSMDRMSWI